MEINCKLEVLYSFEGCINDPWQLKCVQGTILHLREEYSDGWCHAVNPETRKQGIVPTSWVRKINVEVENKTTRSSVVDISSNHDPKYEKYERMKKAGLPEGAIINAMARDGIATPDGFFRGQQNVPSQVCKINRVLDPKYEKYERMKKAGLPEGAIVNAMARDGVTPPQSGGVLNAEATLQSNAGTINKVHDPKYEKYERMKKAGLPEGAIVNAMNRDGITPPDGYFNGGNSGTIQSGFGTKVSDSKYEKYERMKKAGLPEGAVLNAMNRDGIAPPENFFLDQDLRVGPLNSTMSKNALDNPDAKTTGPGPSSFLDSIKSFDKNKLQTASVDCQNNDGNTDAGNSLLAGIKGFNRNALKKADISDRKTSSPTANSSSTSGAKSMMDLIRERAQERKKRAQKSGSIDTLVEAKTNESTAPSHAFSPRTLRKTSINKVIPSDSGENTPTKPAWMQVKLKSTPSSKHLI